MITINEIIDMFCYYDKFTNPCRDCGSHPQFYYNDTCTTESVVVLKCGCKTINRTISLVQLSQVALPKLYISEVLAEMVNTWNGSVE